MPWSLKRLKDEAMETRKDAECRMRNRYHCAEENWPGDVRDDHQTGFAMIQALFHMVFDNANARLLFYSQAGRLSRSLPGSA